MTGFEKFVFESHLRKPKIRNQVLDLPKPIISQTLFTNNTRTLLLMASSRVVLPMVSPLLYVTSHDFFLGGSSG